MDVAYNQHSSHERRKNRSSPNLNHLSLAPLTSKLPLTDDDYLPDVPTAVPRVHSTSYLQGRSAPTTPALLSRSPVRSRSSSRRGSILLTSTAVAAGALLPKSKSTTYLHHHNKRPSGSGALSPTLRRHHHNGGGGGGGGAHSSAGRDYHNDSDWMLRTGTLLTSEYREYKGQSWLVSRASSTSLGGLHHHHDEADAAEEAAFERELARERENHAAGGFGHHHHQSRRGSVVVIDPEEMLLPGHSPPEGGSRYGSGPVSRVGSRSQMGLPTQGSGYFDPHHLHHHHHMHEHHHLDQDQLLQQHTIAGPDFVNLDEKLEVIEPREEDTSVEDEAYVRRLVKREQQAGAAAGGFWLGNVLGWRLFSVEEKVDEEEEDEEDEEAEGGPLSSSDGGAEGDDEDEGEEDEEEEEEDSGAETPPGSPERRGRPRGPDRARDLRQQLAGITSPPQERVPPPKADEGGWNDAAWLLSVATKVLM